MTTIGELTDSLITQGLPIEGIDEDGTPHVITGQSLTQQQIDILTAEFAIWDAQTDAQKLQSAQFQEAKAFGVAIKNALDDIGITSTINLSTNPHIVYDTDGTTPLLTLPNDADWGALTNAGVKSFVRDLSILFAMVLAREIADKDGWWEIMKYIKSELQNGS